MLAPVSSEVIESDGEELVITTGQMLEARGFERGQAAFLLGLLVRRFGELPAEVLDRIQRETDEAALIAWGDRLFDARTPEEVIEG